jgi:hypothetical protein
MSPRPDRSQPAAGRPAPRAGRRALLAGLLLAGTASGGLAGDAPLRIDTLVYSPSERATIAAARQGGRPALDPLHGPVVVNGFVQRRGGRSTVWLNEQPLAEGQAGNGTAFPRIEGNAVRIDGQKTRVGETFDRNTGERTDLLPDGALATRRAP